MKSGINNRGVLQLRWAGVLLLIQGVLMEASAFVALLVLLVANIPQQTLADNAEVFALDYLNDNLYLMMALSGVFATLRILGAIGLLKNRMWGLTLSLANCLITLVLMVFLLPAGLVDGILTGAALVLILMAWAGTNQHGRPTQIVPGTD